MKKTLNLFRRKTSQEQFHLARDDTGRSNELRNAAVASNNSSNMSPTLSYGDAICLSNGIAHETMGLTSIPDSPDLPPTTEHPNIVFTSVNLKHNINKDHTPGEAPDLTHATLLSTRNSNTNKTSTSDNQIHRTGFTDLSDSEQQMASALENLKKLIEAEEQYSRTLTLLKALDLYLLTDKTFTIILDDPNCSSAAVHKAWLELLPHHLRAICRAADSSNVRDKHDLESVIHVSAERISAAKPVSFLKEWSHAEQRTRMTAALTAMRDGLPELARRWNVAVRKMKEEEVLGDLRKVVDGMKGRRTARVFM
ncbi:hypothetical protein MMC17_004751 [Xylographa soralifera]|nr:hypothetical protein [Xylographa soralifera]